MAQSCVLLVLGLLASTAQGFYLPGVASLDFRKKDTMSPKVNKLSSINNQLPYEYYSLPFCRPEKILASDENLGEVLRGDRIENSLYQFQMRADESCKVLCRIQPLTVDQANAFRNKIEDDYRVDMILDNLPVAMVNMWTDEKTGAPIKTYALGYPVGLKARTFYTSQVGQDEVRYFLHNHLRFTILIHKDAETDLSRIVGFEVEPFSVKHEYEDRDATSPVLNTCNPGRGVSVSHDTAPQPVQEGVEVVFTYDVRFTLSDIPWASRWDPYLLMTDGQIHWFSIISSVMIVLFLTGMLAVITIRVLRRDITNYNQLESGEDAQEEMGWKLVHGDVFRPPAGASWLASLVGTGVQLFGMTVATMIFALLGFLSPANRGGLMTAMLMMFVFMGLFAGYFSSCLYKTFRGGEWMRTTLRTALLFPGVCFAIFFSLNMLIGAQKSSGAVPPDTLFALGFLWFGISVPLLFVGSYFGYKKPAPEDPAPINKTPRQIPEQPWYMNPLFSCLVGGVLPFGAVFIELFFILTSMWQHQFYYVFGFLSLVFVILIITCSEITIVLCYFQLCSEDYHWWWRSYFTSGTSALYLFAYSTFYFYSKTTITKTVPMLMYFGYMFMISVGFFCLTGTIGFYACYMFVRNIYARNG